MVPQFYLAGAVGAAVGRKVSVPIIEGLEKIVVGVEGVGHRLCKLVVTDDVGRTCCSVRAGLVSLLGGRNACSHLHN